jgi:MFS transporter, DHA1 family, inner membrane transport protein
LPIAKISDATTKFARAVTFSDGVVAASVNFSWRLILFKTLGESYNAYGGALAAASIVGAIMGLGVGRLIDLGHHKKSLQIGVAIMACTVCAEAFGYASPWSAVIANTIGAIAGPLYMSAIMSPYYNAGKSSACALRFNVIGESGFDTGAGLSCLVAAIILWFGFGPFWILILGLFGCLSAYLVLHDQMKAFA